MRDAWHEKAHCKGVSSEIFFPDASFDSGTGRVWKEARSFCAVCPVIDECLNFVLPFEEATGRRNGFWAGMTPKERDQHVYYQQRVKP
jgi:hypothetical protein